MRDVVDTFLRSFMVWGAILSGLMLVLNAYPL